MTTDYIIDGKENKEFLQASHRLIDDDELVTLDGEDFARLGKL